MTSIVGVSNMSEIGQILSADVWFYLNIPIVYHVIMEYRKNLLGTLL